jgi:ectoine hydroxylase-related dioxygenase (phytanoyl-CoA dioxygenase family)
MKNSYEFTAESTLESIIRQLKKYGVALVPNYLNATKLLKLNEEFQRSIAVDHQSLTNRSKHPNNPKGRVARLNPNHAMALQEFPEITAAFQDALMRQVAHAYYAPHGYSFNEAVFITNEFESEVNILPWHFDRIQSLKFWFNLTDTTKENGAFEYCPGTHWEGRYRAGYHMSQGCPVVDIPNDIDEELIRNPVSMELKAGDLLIFDADGFHRGGIVQPGRERRVLRAHTYPTGRRYGDKRFSSGWWVSSPLNINRWFKSSTTRVLGDRIQEATINRYQHDISKKKTLDD